MPRFKLLFKCIGQAVCANGLKALAGLVPLGGVVYDVAADALQRLREERQDDEIRALMEEAVRASPEEVKKEADAVADEVAAGQPEEVRHKLGVYLAQLPAGLRQSFKRPSDPAGRSVPFTFSMKRPEDLLQLLPSRLPRFQPGDRPAGVGDWELAELLGVGGFGEVWKARHVYFDGIAPVALKFCLDSAARDRLLKHEANVLNQVMRQGRHPGIVPLLDASLSTDPPCLKYEYIEGGDLTGLVRDWQQGTDRPRWELATRVVLQLAEVVGFAHSLSPPIVHRDLKPANVLVQRAPGGEYRLRVTDFGIGGAAASQTFAEARQGATRGDLLGNTLRGSHTPLYASPQQVRGEAPDPRDDVHALGVIWYQLLTGDLASGAPTGLWAEELEEMGLGKGLVRLLGACVARPEKRPKDASVLAEQLSALLAPPVPAPAPKPAKAVKPPEPAAEPAPAPDKLPKFLRTGDTSAISWLLDLTNKEIGDEGAKALARSARLANLSVLILSGNGIGDEGVKALAESPHAMNLTRLVLWDNRVGDEGVKALAASPYLGNLTTLDLGRNRVGDEGVKALAAAPTMANLGALILVSNHVGDEGAKALAESPYLANLAELKPLNNYITSAGVSALRERFGKRVRIY
jgi:eukaryotic-like serine/threonine-protein kinase